MPYSIADQRIPASTWISLFQTESSGSLLKCAPADVAHRRGCGPSPRHLFDEDVLGDAVGLLWRCIVLSPCGAATPAVPFPNAFQTTLTMEQVKQRVAPFIVGMESE